jgi:hypothetical protein
VCEINQRGVVHEGVEYPLDVMIYASGFQWMGVSTFNMVTGRGSRTLNEKRETEGTKTFQPNSLHGLSIGQTFGAHAIGAHRSDATSRNRATCLHCAVSRTPI